MTKKEEIAKRADTRKQMERNVPSDPKLSAFLLLMIQSFLKTGYYRMEHPESKKTREGLHENLTEILRGKREISFIAVDEDGEKDVFIGGIYDAPLRASALLAKGMGEMFIDKFSEYFERKNLSSFSLKASISKPEFEQFINIMTQSHLYEDQSVDVRERLSMDLIKSDILMVSTVFNVDIVGKGRKLPWRVKVSLSRLKRDLNMIPLYRNISDEKRKEIRQMVFEDIVRPLKDPGLMSEMLSNLDLISGDLSGFGPDEFERKIIEHVDAETLPYVARELAASTISFKNAFDQVQEVEILVRLEYLRRIAAKIARKLLDIGTDDELLFVDFVKGRVCSVDELPEALRLKVMKHLALDMFLASPENYFTEVEDSADHGEIRNKLMLLFQFLPDLFERDRFREGVYIFELAKRKGFNHEIHLDIPLMENMSEVISRKASASDKKKTLELLNILSSLDQVGALALLGMIDSENRFVRRAALDALKNKGTEITPLILRVLEKKQGWYYLRNALFLLYVLGSRGPEVENQFRLSLHHAHPNVRIEAVNGAALVLGKNGIPLLIPLLRDESIEVRKKTVASLGVLGCNDAAFADYLAQVLTKREEGDDPLLAQVIYTVAEMALPLVREQKIEDAMLDMLKDTFFSKLLKKETPRHIQMKLGIIRALGAAGTSRSIKALKKYASSGNKELSAAASGAIEKIGKKETEPAKMAL